MVSTAVPRLFPFTQAPLLVNELYALGREDGHNIKINMVILLTFMIHCILRH